MRDLLRGTGGEDEDHGGLVESLDRVGELCNRNRASVPSPIRHILLARQVRHTPCDEVGDQPLRRLGLVRLRRYDPPPVVLLLPLPFGHAESWGVAARERAKDPPKTSSPSAATSPSVDDGDGSNINSSGRGNSNERAEGGGKNSMEVVHHRQATIENRAEEDDASCVVVRWRSWSVRCSIIACPP